MRILCTFPGKHGDSLWAMPTVRAISEAVGEPIDLLMAPSYAGILPLYRLQPYIGRADAWPSWQVQNTAPMTPWSPFEETLHHEALGLPETYDRIVHLGYREWPTAPLPQYVYSIARREYPNLAIAPLDLQRPWIAIQAPPDPGDLVIGFTDEWFELKLGVVCCVLEAFSRHDPNMRYRVTYPAGSRWDREIWQLGRLAKPTDWLETARLIAGARVTLGCCSAFHVLSCALGKRTVVMEPNPHRYHPIFWPEAVRNRVHQVRGGDGLPTHDARHVTDAVAEALHA